MSRALLLERADFSVEFGLRAHVDDREARLAEVVVYPLRRRGVVRRVLAYREGDGLGLDLVLRELSARGLPRAYAAFEYLRVFNSGLAEYPERPAALSPAARVAVGDYGLFAVDAERAYALRHRSLGPYRSPFVGALLRVHVREVGPRRVDRSGDVAAEVEAFGTRVHKHDVLNVGLEPVGADEDALSRLGRSGLHRRRVQRASRGDLRRGGSGRGGGRRGLRRYLYRRGLRGRFRSGLRFGRGGLRLGRGLLRRLRGVLRRDRDYSAVVAGVSGFLRGLLRRFAHYLVDRGGGGVGRLWRLGLLRGLRLRGRFALFGGGGGLSFGLVLGGFSAGLLLVRRLEGVDLRHYRACAVVFRRERELRGSRHHRGGERQR